MPSLESSGKRAGFRLEDSFRAICDREAAFNARDVPLDFALDVPMTDGHVSTAGHPRPRRIRGRLSNSINRSP